MPIGSKRLNSISAVAQSAPVVYSGLIAATGGTITQWNDGVNYYKQHAYYAAGADSFIVTNITGTPAVDVLLLGGGGAGGGAATTGSSTGGGGGAGQFIESLQIPVTVQTYTLSIAASRAGVANASGLSGNSTTGFGLTAAGGGGGTAGAVGLAGGTASGGGAGSNSATSYAGGSGVSTGGANFPGTSSTKSGGGGGGANGNGLAATSSQGGNGGAGKTTTILQNPIVFCKGGGGASIGTAGLGGGIVGAGKGAIPGVAGSAGSDGGGGGGAAGYLTGARMPSTGAGYSGGSGTIVVRYKELLEYLDLAYTASSATSSIVIPADAPVGSYAFLFDRSTNITQVVPSGWTLINSVSTTGIRTTISYKKLVSGNPGATITGQGATTTKFMMVLTGNIPASTISVSTVSSQATTAVPTNQTLDIPQGPSIGFAVYAATGAITTRGWTVGSPSESTNGTSLYIKRLVGIFPNDPASTVISMSDSGTNTLQSFYCTFT